MDKLLWIYLWVGSLTILIAWPMILEKVPPNPFYGFRIRATLEDPRLWYPVNKMMGWWLAWSGLGLLVMATGLYLGVELGWFQMSVDVYSWVCLIPVVGISGVGIWRSWQYMREIQRKMEK